MTADGMHIHIAKYPEKEMPDTRSGKRQEQHAFVAFEPPLSRL